MINFASRIGATVTKFWTPDVTHVIAATDSNGACARTLKVLMGILNGQWILKMDCKLLGFFFHVMSYCISCLEYALMSVICLSCS